MKAERWTFTTTIDVAPTIRGAQTQLTHVDVFASSNEWMRAGIVAAYVQLADREGRPETDTCGSYRRLSPTAFAALGVRGLTSHTTVRRYVRTWLDANGGVYPEPGARLAYPEERWRDAFKRTLSNERATCLTPTTEDPMPEAPTPSDALPEATDDLMTSAMGRPTPIRGRRPTPSAPATRPITVARRPVPRPEDVDTLYGDLDANRDRLSDELMGKLADLRDLLADLLGEA